MFVLFDRFFKRLAAVSAALMLAVCMGVPIFAFNPATGDSSGTMIVIMGGLLAVSLVLIIIFAILSAKKKKK